MDPTYVLHMTTKVARPYRIHDSTANVAAALIPMMEYGVVCSYPDEASHAKDDGKMHTSSLQHLVPDCLNSKDSPKGTLWMLEEVKVRRIDRIVIYLKVGWFSGLGVEMLRSR